MLINERYNGQISDIERSTHSEILGLLNWIRGFQATNEGNSVAEIYLTSPSFQHGQALSGGQISENFQFSEIYGSCFQMSGVFVMDQAPVSCLLFDGASHCKPFWKMTISKKLPCFVPKDSGLK